MTCIYLSQFLQKACRVNLQFGKIICDNMIDKSMNGINCGNVNVTVKQLLNDTFNEYAHTTFYNATNFGVYRNSSLEEEVCRAEIESQKLISTISGYMAPIGELKK